ncbi:DUF2585 family protein [Paracoccus beibuensis]|uniref:DUF2585 family protein n=1 Tax=Paracoccus beibuensis TaxID=547602 RepID=UPI00223F5D71|nr:DUF2585 family protein [Paracoccus beibuensis]
MSSDSSSTVPGAPTTPPRARRGITRGQAIAALLGATLAKIGFFLWLDRPVGCDCGRIWALPSEPRLNSQVMLDPYTLLHVVFGAVLAVVLMRLRPRWTGWTLVMAVVISSTLWELAENLPPVILMFNYDAGDPLAYHGDSLLNASADTAAALLGAGMARLLPVPAVLLAALAVELWLSAWIGDGFVIATLRAIPGLG